MNNNYRYELLVGDKFGVRCVTVGFGGRNQKFYLWKVDKLDEENIGVKYTVLKIPRHSDERLYYLYEFEKTLTFEDVMKCIGFEYVDGRTVIDGEFIPKSSIGKTLRELVPTPNRRQHALINCDSQPENTTVIFI